MDFFFFEYQELVIKNVQDSILNLKKKVNIHFNVVMSAEYDACGWNSSTCAKTSSCWRKEITKSDVILKLYFR